MVGVRSAVRRAAHAGRGQVEAGLDGGAYAVQTRLLELSMSALSELPLRWFNAAPFKIKVGLILGAVGLVWSVIAGKPGPSPDMAAAARVDRALALGNDPKAAWREDPYLAKVCHGPPLRAAIERQIATERGYDVEMALRCITRASYESVERARAKFPTTAAR